MRMIYSTLLVISLGLLTCDTREAPMPEPNAPTPQTALLGTWETIDIRVDQATFQGSDADSLFRIREGDWGKTYGVRPARTVFTPDGKLRRTHRMRDGQVANVVNGLWKVQGPDSLFIIEPNKTLYYGFELQDDRLTLHGLVDHDLDGARDDRYRAELRLISKTQ